MKTILIKEKNIHITEDSYVVDMGDLADVAITTEQNITVHYTLVTEKEVNNRHILLSAGVNFAGKGVIATNAHVQVITDVIGDNVSSALDLLAIATDNADISVEGVARVNAPYRKVHTRVDQTNILIGKNTIIRGVPRLEIATDDIEGGHSCKIHRLHGDALFYLQSHGLDEKQSEGFLLNSEILRHLDTLPEELKEEKCFGIHKMLFGAIKTQNLDS